MVGGRNGDVSLDEGLPLADERAELVRGEVETMEVGQAVLALDLIDTELNLAEGVVFVLLQIRERNLEDTALQSIVGVLETRGPVDQGLSDTGHYVRIVPNLARSRALRCRGRGVLLSDGERRGGLYKTQVSSVVVSDELIRENWQPTLMLYQSLREKGSWVFFLRPFLPLDSLLFLHQGISHQYPQNVPEDYSYRASHEESEIWERDVLANSHLDGAAMSTAGQMCCLVSDGDREIEVTKFGGFVARVEIVISLCGRSPHAEKLELWVARELMQLAARSLGLGGPCFSTLTQMPGALVAQVKRQRKINMNRMDIPCAAYDVDARQFKPDTLWHL